MRVLAASDGDHAPELAVGQQVDRHVGERDRHHLIDGVRIARAQVVGQVRMHGLDAGAALQLLGKGLAHIGLVPMAIGVRLTDLAKLAALPDGALAGDDERVAGGIEAAIVGEEVRQGVEVERRLGDDAASARHVGRVPRRVTGVSAEDAEHAEALVAAEGGALAVDELLGSGHGSREADAVLGALDVVVHGLGDGDDGKSLAPEPGGVAERVVATDGHEAVDLEPLEVLEDDGRQVVAPIFRLQALQALRVEVLGKRAGAHVRRARARGVEHGAAGPVDRPCHDPVEGSQEAAAILECGIHVGQALPAAADAEAHPADLAGPIHDALDDRIEPGDVPAAGENGNAFHDCTGHAARSEPDL